MKALLITLLLISKAHAGEATDRKLQKFLREQSKLINNNSLLFKIEMLKKYAKDIARQVEEGHFYNDLLIDEVFKSIEVVLNDKNETLKIKKKVKPVQLLKTC